MAIDHHHRFNELVNGEGTRYAVILSALRENLKSDIPTSQGCIAFYNYDPDRPGKMLMKVFPFRPEIIESNFPASPKMQIAMLERINEDRPYEAMHHLKNFRANHTTKSHFNINIPDKEVLEHNKTLINGKTWPEFAEDQSIDNNIFDNLLFNSRERGFQVFPLPVLSSPCMLLIIPASERINAPESTAAKIRESIDFYLYNRLINEISKDLKPGQIKDKQELIERFLKELSQVAIPIKYEVNGKVFNCFDWYGKWQTDPCSTLALTLTNEPVKIYMPTFCWHNGVMIHDTPYFGLKLKQVKETIQSIFDLVFGYWQTINSKKLLLENEISPLIRDLKENASYIRKMKENVEEKLIDQNKKVEELSKLVIKMGADKSQLFENEFYFTKKQDAKNGKFWTIRYKNKHIDSGDDIGYEYLHYIISNPHTEIPYTKFGISGISDKTRLVDKDTIGSKNRFQAKINEITKDRKNRLQDLGDYEDLLANLAGFISVAKDLGDPYSENQKLLDQCLGYVKMMGWLTNEEFKAYEERLKISSGQSKKNSVERKEENAITANIRSAARKLKRNTGGIMRPIIDCIDIGKVSIFKPTPDLEVPWKFFADSDDLM